MWNMQGMFQAGVHANMMKEIQRLNVNKLGLRVVYYSGNSDPKKQT